MDYSDRKVVAVALGAIMPLHLADGDGLSSSVTITLSALNNPEAFGPQITVGLAVPVQPSDSLQTAQEALLASAHAILQRAAQESLEALRTLRDKRSWLDQVHQQD